MTSKVPLSLGIRAPAYCMVIWAPQVHILNEISIGSSVFAYSTCVTNTHTRRLQTVRYRGEDGGFSHPKTYNPRPKRLPTCVQSLLRIALKSKHQLLDAIFQDRNALNVFFVRAMNYKYITETLF